MEGGEREKERWRGPEDKDVAAKCVWGEMAGRKGMKNWQGVETTGNLKFNSRKAILGGGGGQPGTVFRAPS